MLSLNTVAYVKSPSELAEFSLASFVIETILKVKTTHENTPTYFESPKLRQSSTDMCKNLHLPGIHVQSLPHRWQAPSSARNAPEPLYRIFSLALAVACTHTLASRIALTYESVALLRFKNGTVNLTIHHFDGFRDCQPGQTCTTIYHQPPKPCGPRGICQNAGILAFGGIKHETAVLKAWHPCTQPTQGMLERTPQKQAAQGWRPRRLVEGLVEGFTQVEAS